MFNRIPLVADIPVEGEIFDSYYGVDIVLLTFIVAIAVVAAIVVVAVLLIRRSIKKRKAKTIDKEQ